MKPKRVLPFVAALGLFTVLILASASVALGAPAPTQPNQVVQVTFIKVLCPSYTVVPANKNPTNLDATGGRAGQLDTSYQTTLVSPSTDIPRVCSRADGWHFQLYDSVSLGTTVGAALTTGADGTGTGSVTITLDGTELALAQTGGYPTGLWLSEIEQPGVAAFGALRCNRDILNGDDVESISNVGLTAQHIYCIAYNVAVSLATPSPAATPAPTATLAPTATATQTPAGTPFQSFLGATAAPFQSFLGATAAPSSATPPPTATINQGSDTGSTPLPALLTSLAFAGLAIFAVNTQRRSTRR